MLARGDHARSRSRQSFTTGTSSSSHETASSTTAWSSPRSMNGTHGGAAGTARTSVWSSSSPGGSDDAKTAMPDLLGTDGEDSDARRQGPARQVAAVNRHTGRVGKLIDLGSESEREAPKQQIPSGGEPTPGEKLRALLRQMNSDVSDMAPARASSPPRLAGSPELRPSGSSSEGRAARVSAWRTQRTGSSYDRTDEERSGEGEEEDEGPVAGPSYTSSPERRPDQQTDDGRRRSIESDSPPTPPPRVMNPYLHTARKISLEKPKEERIPTRVAVLHASTSARSPSPPPQPLRPLEQYIASHPGPSDRSRSMTSSHASFSPHKGKEREHPSASQTPRLDRFAVQQTPRHPRQSNGVPARTPRRFSVELAPDDSMLFAEELEVHGLEIRGEVELDLDEGMSSRVEDWDEDPAARAASPGEDVDGTSPRRSTDGSGRLSRNGGDTFRVTERSRRESGDSLPALPEPDLSLEDEGHETASVSSRRAAMFRSVSRSPRSGNGGDQSHSSTSRNHSAVTHSSESLPRPASRSPFGPDHSDFASPSNAAGRKAASPSPSGHRNVQRESPRSTPDRLSVPAARSPQVAQQRTTPETSSSNLVTPQRTPAARTVARPNTSRLAANATLSTPHPPGWLSAGSPAGSRGNVRFSPLSPLRQNDQDWSVSRESTAGTHDSDVIRLKLSPGKKGTSAKAETSRRSTQSNPADTSFTARAKDLSRSLLAKALPAPSRTLASAQDSLSAASAATRQAADRVERSQRDFLDALAVVQSTQSGLAQSTAKLVSHTWGWSTWAWWLSMELLLLWGVFRVTLDYAASAHYAYDPFHPMSPLALSTVVPLPSGMSSFVVSHRTSANFFDLLDSYDVWRRISALGLPISTVSGSGPAPVGSGGGGGGGRVLSAAAALGIGGLADGVRFLGGVPS